LGYFQLFADWCKYFGVPSCPANPITVAGWIVIGWQCKSPLDFFLKVLDAIARVHDANNWANPCATYVVRAALEKVAGDVKPPQTWNKDERRAFLTLPVEVRDALSRRDLQSRQEISRVHNGYAGLQREISRLELELKQLKDGKAV